MGELMAIILIALIIVGIYFYLKYGGEIKSANSGKIDDSKVSTLDGFGDCEIDVVGESNYQKNLERIVGERNPKGVRLKTKAVVWFEDDNDYDKKAVCVDIDGKTIGYLSREDARSFRKYIKTAGIGGDEWLVDALIRGGGNRAGEWLSYGVKLDLPIQGN
jgi:hypothetical protein